MNRAMGLTHWTDAREPAKKDCIASCRGATDAGLALGAITPQIAEPDVGHGAGKHASAFQVRMTTVRSVRGRSFPDKRSGRYHGVITE